MQRSTGRLLTTHTGSLPRPADLDKMIFCCEGGEPVSQVAFRSRIRRAVAEAVARQLEAGVDVVGDGEMGKVGYSTYVKDRLAGFDGDSRPLRWREVTEFPEVYEQLERSRVSSQPVMRPACTRPVSCQDSGAVAADIADLKAAAQGHEAADLFMTAASPGVIAMFLANEYYASEEEYLYALADAMKPEYDAISAAGILLQLDCPDLAASRTVRANAELTSAQFRNLVRMHVEVLNYAVRDVPPEQMRLHLCWGNSPGPHIYDVPLADIVDIVLESSPAGLSFEAANGRHEHEWTLWQSIELPPGKVLIPGVIDSKTNIVEHPDLVAQRIVRFADAVGRENVIAGTDCGFGTFAANYQVHPRITWLKLRALAEGAETASRQLWHKAASTSSDT
jgi:5-methyltetrahydropteroyltriglutamate--homocysteine methyltransferase